MIRPGCEVELSHNESMFRATTQLWEINKINVSYDYTDIHLYREFPSGVVCQYLLGSDGDNKGTKGQGPSLWPVLVTLDLVSLHQVG